MRANKSSNHQQYDYLQKIIIIGDSGVGKSNLLLRFKEGTFVENYMATIGLNFVYQVIQVEGTRIKLQIWDTAGQDKFKTITKNYYRNSQGVLVLFAIDSIQSFRSLQNWLDDLIQTGADNAQIMFVANKIDLAHVRTVQSAQAQTLAKKHGVQYMECSAKTGEGVREVFEGLARLMKNKIRQQQAAEGEQGKVELRSRRFTPQCCQK